MNCIFFSPFLSCARLCFLVWALCITIPVLSEGFVEGTLVSTPQGFVAIEQLSIGDQVITCDFDKGCSVASIIDVMHDEAPNFVRFRVNNVAIDVASDHLFLASLQQEWIPASDLAEGMCVLSAPLKAAYIASVEKIDRSVYVYNLSLATHHNYLVSEHNIVVHNFAEVGCATFATIKGTAVLNAFALANPIAATVALCAGGAALTGYVGWTFWKAFKRSSNDMKHAHAKSAHNADHVDNEAQRTCGTSKVDHMPLLINDCLYEAHSSPHHFTCSAQKDAVIYHDHAPGITENLTPKPCNHQEQGLPEFESNDLACSSEKTEIRQGCGKSLGHDSNTGEENEVKHECSTNIKTSSEAETYHDAMPVNELADLSDVLVRVEERGSTGRAEPKNLAEKKAMHEVMSNPKGKCLDAVIMTDKRWPASEGWVKKAQCIDLGNNSKIDIHFVHNEILNLYDDFKFIDNEHKRSER